MGKEKKFKFLSSGKMFVGIMLFFFCLDILSLVLVYTSGQKLSMVTHIIMIFFTVFLPLILIIFGANMLFSTVLIDEEGIKRRLFGIFFERKIKWEELYELRPYHIMANGMFIYASKIDLTGYNYSQAMKNKNVIRFGCTPETIYAIRTFCDKEILGVPEEEITKIIQTHIERQGKKGKN